MILFTIARTRATTTAGILCLMMSTAFAGSAGAATLKVPSQYATIRAAVNAAAAGDTVLVADGTYSSAGDLGLTISKSITIESVNGAASTIIDCSSDNFAYVETNCTIQGFTFENADSGESGVIEMDASGTITQCTFKNDTNLGGNGAAIEMNDGTTTVTDCTFDQQNGSGAISLSGANATITNCTFTNGNGEIGGGGGAINMNTGTVTVSGSTFTGNTGGSNAGGVFYWRNGTLTVTDSTFTNNSGSYGGVILEGAQGIDSPTTFTRCVFTGNSASIKGGVAALEGGSSGTTNFIATDCLFIGNTAGSDGAAIDGNTAGSSPNKVNVTNCSFYGNNVTKGATTGVICGGATTTTKVANSILYGDTGPKEISTANPSAGGTTVTKSDIHQAAFAGGNGDINADPLYIVPGTGDLHLSISSPCIDTGTSTGAPITDYSQYPWGNSVSMGAFSPIMFAVTAPSTATAGTSFPVDVTAMTADLSTTVTGYTGTVQITSSDGTAVLPPNSTLTNGAGVFSVTLNTDSSQTITATDTVEPAFTGTSTVSVQTLTSIVITPGPSVTYTLPVLQQFTAVAYDQNGIPMSPQPSLIWYVGAGQLGSITYLGGLFHGGPVPGVTTVRAVSGSTTGKTVVTLKGAPVTIAAAAAANPNPANHMVTNLSALGAYTGAGGASGLTYSWVATGPAAVTYSSNDSQSARTTIATFAEAGTYQFTVTITSPAGTSTTSSVSVTVNQTVSSISVTPGPTLTVGAHASQQFTATANDQFGNPLSVQPAISWQLGAGSAGSITDSGGLFRSASTAGSATVEAVSHGVVGTCAVTVN
jgi:hypothetical protein